MAMIVDPATGYYEKPYSLTPLPEYVHRGLAVMGSLAMLSFITIVSVLVMIVHRYVIWSKHAEKTSGYNQCVVLVSNLLVVDLFQAIAFVISFRWYQLDGVLAPTKACYMQAGFLEFGNLSSGSFVFAIAIHTAWSVVKKRSAPPTLFRRSIWCIWFFGFLCTISGPLAHGSDFYARAGHWCWISQKYGLARLVLHYIWIFTFQIGSAIIYVSLYIYIWQSSRLTQSHSPLAPRNAQLLKAARCMIAYPLVYMFGTLPIAVARMMMIAGKAPDDRYLIWAGCMLASCGWMHGLLYTITRKMFRDSEIERSRTESAVSTVGPLSAHKLSDSSMSPLPKRPRLVEWMRTMSDSSARSPLARVDSVVDTISERPKFDRQPSNDSTWTQIEMTGTRARGMSFVDFLNGHDDEEFEIGRVDDLPMDTIPESPLMQDFPQHLRL